MRIIIERMKDDNRLRVIVEGGIKFEALELIDKVDEVTTQACWVFVDPEKVDYVFKIHRKDDAA